MKRRTKKTFFELKVTFYFDLFQFFIGGYYDHVNKAVHLSLIPTLIIKLENARPKLIITEADKANMDYLDKKLKKDKKKVIVYRADSKGRMKLQKDKK